MPSQTTTPGPDLRRAIEHVLGAHCGAPVSLRKLQRRRSAYASSYSIENLEAELEDGRRWRLVLKDTSRAASHTVQHHVRPDFVYDPEREIAIYEHLLQSRALGTPLFYGAVCSRQQARFWLFLERVDGAALWQLGRISTWTEAARWLARLHGEPVLGPGHGGWHLLRYDGEFYHRWLLRAERIVGQSGYPAPLSAVKRFEKLAGNYAAAIEELLAIPMSLIHGEFYPSNILVRRSSRSDAQGDAAASRLGSRICAIDWEMAGIGPGTLDLAALTSGKWDDSARQQMIEAYHKALNANGQWLPSASELHRGVKLGQLHFAIQWLGWAESWSPPEEHAQDWLGDALRLADELGF